MAYEGITGALGAVNAGMTDARKSRMELYLKNAQLHQMAEQQMFAQQQQQQYALARQEEQSRLAMKRDADKYEREGYVGDAFEPALRAYAEKHNIPIPDGRIPLRDSASLMTMIKMEMGNKAAVEKARLAGSGSNKVLAGLLAKQKQKVAEARSAMLVMDPHLSKIAEFNTKSRGGYVGAGQQMFESAMGGNESEDFKNTASTINGLKDMVAKVLKSTFGAQLSDGERKYMEDVLGAATTMSKVERAIAIANIKSTLASKVKEHENTYAEMGGTDMPSGPSDADRLTQALDEMDGPGSNEDNGLGQPTPDAEALFEAEASAEGGADDAPYDVTGTEADSENFTEAAPFGTDALGVPSIEPPPGYPRRKK